MLSTVTLASLVAPITLSTFDLLCQHSIQNHIKEKPRAFVAYDYDIRPSKKKHHKTVIQQNCIYLKNVLAFCLYRIYFRFEHIISFHYMYVAVENLKSFYQGWNILFLSPVYLLTSLWAILSVHPFSFIVNNGKRMPAF